MPHSLKGVGNITGRVSPWPPRPRSKKTGAGPVNNWVGLGTETKTPKFLGLRLTLTLAHKPGLYVVVVSLFSI